MGFVFLLFRRFILNNNNIIFTNFKYFRFYNIMLICGLCLYKSQRAEIALRPHFLDCEKGTKRFAETGTGEGGAPDGDVEGAKRIGGVSAGLAAVRGGEETLREHRTTISPAGEPVWLSVCLYQRLILIFSFPVSEIRKYYIFGFLWVFLNLTLT